MNDVCATTFVPVICRIDLYNVEPNTVFLASNKHVVQCDEHGYFWHRMNMLENEDEWAAQGGTGAILFASFRLCPFDSVLR